MDHGATAKYNCQDDARLDLAAATKLSAASSGAIKERVAVKGSFNALLS
jgi:hypothetical protein